MLGYAVSISILVSYWTLAFVFFIVIIVGITSIAFTKKALGGFISFKEAFTSFFLMLVVSSIISTAMNFILFNVIDKDFEEVVKEKQIEAINGQRDWVINKMGNAPEDKIDEVYAKFDEAIEKVKSDNPYSALSLIKGFAIFVSIFSVFGLLLALILKKKDPALE
jgi:hypothetical protein